MKAIDRETSVCLAALTHYGVHSQIGMVFEEMSELQKELCKYLRGDANEDHICEELADVEIMLRQMKLFFDRGDKVQRYKQAKINRLASRLELE